MINRRLYCTAGFSQEMLTIVGVYAEHRIINKAYTSEAILSLYSTIMYSTYTPQFRMDEGAADIDEAMYNAALPFDHEQSVHDKTEDIVEPEMMDEVIDAPDPYHIVVTELNMGKEGICSLVSMTKAAHSAEKV